MTEQLNLSMPPLTRQQQIEQQFLQYHQEHPEVWDLFRRFTFQAINRGFEHSSAKFIINIIRWESKGPKWVGPNEFKIGDIYPPYYARMFMREYPEYGPRYDADGNLEQGFFRLRKLRSAEWAPTTTPASGPDDMVAHEKAGLEEFMRTGPYERPEGIWGVR